MEGSARHGAAPATDLIAVEKEPSLSELAIELGLVALQGGADGTLELDIGAVSTERQLQGLQDVADFFDERTLGAEIDHVAVAVLSPDQVVVWAPLSRHGASASWTDRTLAGEDVRPRGDEVNRPVRHAGRLDRCRCVVPKLRISQNGGTLGSTFFRVDRFRFSLGCHGCVPQV